MISKISLLVHAGAPSSRQHDEKYKAQAKAYATFDDNVVKKITPISQFNSIHARQHSPVQDELEHAENPLVVKDDLPLYLDDTQLAYNALDSQILTSSLVVSNASTENAESQLSPQQHSYRSKCGRQEVIQTPFKDPSDPPIGQSSYLESPILHRTSKKRRLSLSLLINHEAKPKDPFGAGDLSIQQPNVSSQAHRANHPIASTEPTDENVFRLSQNLAQADDEVEVTSELLTSYSLSGITSESSRARARKRQRLDFSGSRSISDSGPTRSADNSTPKDAQALSPARMEKQPTPAASTQQDDSTTTETSSNKPTTAVLKPSNPKQSLLENPSSILCTLPKTITPPSPPTTNDKYTTHITSSLHYLATSLNIEKAYQPIATKRDLRPLERGYWLVQCPSSTIWPVAEQVEFWKFLGRVVGIGNVGWGVWCTRGDGEEDGGGVGGTRKRECGEEGLGVVKVFCWGEVVAHVYLLLYVASKSRVRKLGLRWVDSQGEVVVVMRSG